MRDRGRQKKKAGGGGKGKKRVEKSLDVEEKTAALELTELGSDS